MPGFKKPESLMQNNPYFFPKFTQGLALMDEIEALAFKNDQPLLERAVNTLAALDRQYIERAILNETSQAYPPLYYAVFFQIYAQTAPFQSETARAQAFRTAAYNYALNGNGVSSGGCLKRALALDAEGTIQDVMNVALQANAPLYCATLFQLHYNGGYESKQISPLQTLQRAAYCFALAGEEKKLTPLIRKLFNKAPHQLVSDVLNPHYQRTSPLYCAEIYNVLAKQGGFQYESGFSPACSFRWAAYYAALAGQTGRLKYCLNRFIELDENTARIDAESAECALKNPSYSLMLKDKLNRQKDAKHGFRFSFEGEMRQAAEPSPSSELPSSPIW